MYNELILVGLEISTNSCTSFHLFPARKRIIRCWFTKILSKAKIRISIVSHYWVCFLPLNHKFSKWQKKKITQFEWNELILKYFDGNGKNRISGKQLTTDAFKCQNLLTVCDIWSVLSLAVLQTNTSIQVRAKLKEIEKKTMF